MSGPSFEDAEDMAFARVGMGYRADVVAKGVNLQLSLLAESRDGLHGELSVSRVPEGHLLRSRFNVSSMSVRKTTASFLASRSNSVDWMTVLESFCVRVLDAERQGQPWMTVGGNARPVSGQVPYIAAPFLLADRPTILFGDGGVGKSTVATALAVSIASGSEVIPGCRPTVQGAVMVLDWEADADEWHERIVAVSKGAGIAAPEVEYRGCVGPLTAQVEQVAERCDALDVRLLVVDSVGMASPSAREGTDANEAALKLFGALREIGRTSLLIDHISKAGAEAESGSHKPYGSIYKANLARATWEVMRGTATGAEQHIALYHRKANRSSLHTPVALKVIHGSDGEIAFFEDDAANDPRLAASMPLRHRIERALLAKPMTAPELSDELAVGVNTVRVYLSRMRQDKTATKLGDERWAMTEQGRR